MWNAGEQWLTSILDTIDEGIHAVDRDGYTVVYNQAAGRMDGLAPQDVIGQHVLDVFPSLGQDTSTLVQVLQTGRAIRNRQQTYTNVHGMKVHTVNTTLPILSGGQIVGALEVAKDLTQVKHLAEQVIDLQAQVVGGARKRKSRARAEASLAVYRFSQILTRDGSMEEMKDRAMRAAQTSSPVLVYGETGTGKELLVQAIHNASPRSQEPFLALNCAALPATLLEGILFGTVRGSFTGAEDRPGLFELADGGTLFLDEIQSMPLDLQAKLLRVLQEGEVIRVGDTRIRRLSVRVVAAMNQRPEEAIEAHRLRQDLYYRINVVRIDLPPLRDRHPDLPLLTAHFIDKYNGRFHASVTGVDEEVSRLFAKYPWPGNVRELENTIESVMNLVSTGTITARDLPVQLREWSHRQGRGSEAASADVRGTASSRADYRMRAEWRLRSSDSGTASGLSAGNSASMQPDRLGASIGGDRDGGPGAPGALAGRDGGSGACDRVANTTSANEDWVAGLTALGMDRFWRDLAEDRPLDSTVAAMAEGIERLLLKRALDACGGNVKKTSEKIGMPRQTLQYRLKHLGL